MNERRTNKRKADKKTNQGLATIRVASHTETVLPVPPGPPCKQNIKIIFDMFIHSVIITF